MEIFFIMVKSIRLRMFLIIIGWAGLINHPLMAQESIVPVSENSQLFNKKVQSHLKAATDSLPFFDDFSYSTVYPSPDNWQNLNVFINNSYGDHPPSIGVATFDAINSKGYIYTSLSKVPSKADTLTSRYIDLSNVNPDSLYLSFYYQPQGFGDQPEFNDSLVLQFLTPDTVITVWCANGISFESFKKDTLKLAENPNDTLMFKLVMLHINNPVFLTDNFQFRFINYASMGYDISTQTNCDNWNIDYIYLNKGRSAKDTLFRDVAFVEPPGSFLKNYSSIPWSHFEKGIKTELKDLYAHIRNNDKITRNITQIRFDLKDAQTQWVDSFAIGDFDLEAFANRSDLSFQFDSSRFIPNENDAAYFTIKAKLSTDGYDFSKSNNEAYKNVNCENYYAYDDGTAEYAYNLYGDQVRMAAYYYEIFQPDTLRALSMYFLRNQTQVAALESFNIGVWKAVNGAPGERIYNMQNAKPVEFKDSLNQFVTIKLDSAIYLEGDFFIGWDQKPGESINLGFDANTNTTKKRYYKYGQDWVVGDDNKKGSLMLRPIFGKPLDAEEKPEKKSLLSVFPNPSDGKLTVQNMQQVQSGTIRVYNSMGRMLEQHELNTSSFDFSYLKPGIYIISIQSEKNVPQTVKWIKR